MARILTLIPYAPLPLRSGGALRSFHLLRQLARFHEVHAIIFQGEAELRAGQDGYKVPDLVRIFSPIDRPPPPSLFDHLPRRLGPAFQYRWLRRDWRGPAEGTLLRCHHLLREVLLNHDIDVVVFEHLSTMMAAPLVRRLSPNTVRILNAANVDHVLIPRLTALAAGNLVSPEAARTSLAHIEWHEKHLSDSVHSVWVCSADDKSQLATFNDIPMDVIPNGVDIAQRPYDTREEKSTVREILFCGSLTYPPNIDGLIWFGREIWPLVLEQCPAARLTVIGRGGNPEDFWELRNAAGVTFVGEVEDVTPYYRRFGVFVCPLREGSGTRLKILEAMSMGNPVVSTVIGAEGILARHQHDILLANDPRAFAKAVAALLQEPALFHRIRAQARQLVEQHYDWEVIGLQANASIQRFLESHQP